MEVDIHGDETSEVTQTPQDATAHTTRGVLRRAQRVHHKRAASVPGDRSATLMERVTGFEPANGSLGSYCRTTWRHPHVYAW